MNPSHSDAFEQNPGQAVELEACRQESAAERSAYDRVLSDAMKGDATLFARQDYAEEACASSILFCKRTDPSTITNLTPGSQPKSISSSPLTVAGTTRLPMMKPSSSHAHNYPQHQPKT